MIHIRLAITALSIALSALVPRDLPAQQAAAESWQSSVRGAARQPGFLPLFQRADGAILLEVAPNRFDSDFGLRVIISGGLLNVVRSGNPPDEDDGAKGVAVVQFHRAGNRVFLLRLNTRFVAPPGSSGDVIRSASVANSVLQAFRIESEDETSHAVLINVTDFVLSDYSAASKNFKDAYGGKAGIFDRERSFIGRARAFADADEIDATLTYRAPEGASADLPAAADPRWAPLRVHYSMFALPDPPMTPRVADERVGYQSDSLFDFSDERAMRGFASAAERFIHRRRLQKMNPGAALSAPVQPIVFYIDPSVPPEYRAAVRDGVLAWNKAFRAAGFLDALHVRDLPPDDASSSYDVRRSVIRYQYGNPSGGGAVVDPRTGEILSGSINLGTGLTGIDLYDIYVRGRMPSHASDVWPRSPAEWYAAMLKHTVMHEVGHTLGLTHNIRASSVIPYERLHDTAYTRVHGIASSVMDYTALPNVALDPNHQGDFWTTTVGDYDVWAIRYGYENLDAVALRKLVDDAAPEIRAYETDFGSPDPRDGLQDYGPDPMRFARDQLAILRDAEAHLGTRLRDHPSVDLRGIVDNLFVLREVWLRNITKLVGGEYTSRDEPQQHGGDPKTGAVPAAVQQEALLFIMAEGLALRPLNVDSQVLQRLRANRLPSPLDKREDVDSALADRTLTFHQTILRMLFAAPRLTRLERAAVEGPNQARFSTRDLLHALTLETLGSSAWVALSRRGDAPLAMGLQNAYLSQLVRLAQPTQGTASRVDGVPEHVRAFASMELSEIGRVIDGRLRDASDPDLIAHLNRLRALVSRR